MCVCVCVVETLVVRFVKMVPRSRSRAGSTERAPYFRAADDARKMPQTLASVPLGISERLSILIWQYFSKSHSAHLYSPTRVNKTGFEQFSQSAVDPRRKKTKNNSTQKKNARKNSERHARSFRARSAGMSKGGQILPRGSTERQNALPL